MSKETKIYVAVYPDGSFLIRTASWCVERAEVKLKELFDYDIPNEHGINIQEVIVTTQATI